MDKQQNQNKETQQIAKKPTTPQAEENRGPGPVDKIITQNITRGSDISSQVTMLKRLRPAQQQTLMRNISSRQGNRHAQRLMKAYTASNTAADQPTTATGGAEVEGGLTLQTKPDSQGSAYTNRYKPGNASFLPPDSGRGGTVAHRPASPPVETKGEPSLQTKLIVNEPNDVYEQEADRVADRVMQTVAPPTPPEDPGIRGRNEGGPSLLQAKSDGVSPIGSNVETHVDQMRGGGQPLPAEERNFFEERMGADFSKVRVHTDPTAAQTSRDLNARAFTVGTNIAFNAGEYTPGTTAGRTLLAHELTHVVQQGGAVQCKRKEPDAPPTDSSVPPSGDRGELGGLAKSPANELRVTEAKGTVAQCKNKLEEFKKGGDIPPKKKRAAAKPLDPDLSTKQKIRKLTNLSPSEVEILLVAFTGKNKWFYEYFQIEPKERVSLTIAEKLLFALTQYVKGISASQFGKKVGVDRETSLMELKNLGVILGWVLEDFRKGDSNAKSIAQKLQPATPAPTGTSISNILIPENASAGDPYMPEIGNRGYAAQHYTLKLQLDPQKTWFAGDVTIDALVTSAELKQISLDFVGFDIQQVEVDGNNADFSREDKKLLIDLSNSACEGQRLKLHLTYKGEPIKESSAYMWLMPYLGLQTKSDNLSVLSEPDGARYWFPVNDHPRNKATYRFEITVPTGFMGVANGSLIETKPKNSSVTYIWEHNHPMASAVVAVAVGKYVPVEDASPNGVKLRSYVSPENQATFQAMQATIGEMIDWMSNLFGSYPFEAFGYVETANDVGITGASAVESQTMATVSSKYLGDEFTQSHEMAHQWFGDWVSVDSWGEIWRNEGFATYVSLMWLMRKDPKGFEAQMNAIDQAIKAKPSGYPLKNPPPNEMFGSDTFYKGALIVHNLRKKMGDEAFFRGLRDYFKEYGGRTATHAEFQAVMEKAAGSSLESFFQEWLN